jgi:hypothetical protein
MPADRRDGSIDPRREQRVGHGATVEQLRLEADGRIGARAAGFSGTVMKPFSPRELYGAMQAALSKLPAALSHDA